MRSWYLGLAAATLLGASGLGVLTSCGTGCAPGSEVRMRTVASLTTVGDLYAMTFYGCDGAPTTIEISLETPADLLPRVVGHELLHAAGLIDHEASPDCYLYIDVLPGQPAEPCTAEVERLRDVAGTYTVYVESLPLLVYVEAAATLWNQRAEREVFVVVDAGPTEGR